jgi:hypothetical protein
MRRVVPDPGKIPRGAVEDDRPPHEHESLDVMLDGSELVGDVDDRDSELAVQVGEEIGQRLLRLGVDTRRRLVENQERWLPGECLRDERALLHPAGESPDRCIGHRLEADAADRLRDKRAIRMTQPADEPAGSEPAGGNDLAYGRRRVATELRTLRQIAERAPAGEAVGGLAVEQSRALRRPLEPEKDPNQRGLSTTVRACDGHELALAQLEVDTLEHSLAGPIPERNAVKGGSYLHWSAARRVTRLARITER